MRPGVPIVDGTVDLIRLLAFELHDVDFAAGSPATILLLRREHPESWPEPLPSWELRG